MKYIIDRFEENLAVCETEQGEYINIERLKLPIHVKEGDVLVQLDNKLIVDVAETAKRSERIRKLAADLWQ